MARTVAASASPDRQRRWRPGVKVMSITSGVAMLNHLRAHAVPLVGPSV